MNAGLNQAWNSSANGSKLKVVKMLRVGDIFMVYKHLQRRCPFTILAQIRTSHADTKLYLTARNNVNRECIAISSGAKL